MKINKSNQLNREKLGIWGTLSNEGGLCEVDFIQTVLTGDDIDNVKRISDIPESQKWKVKDLFQRNVDRKRVYDEIIPYLNDVKKIKYFNPLTLIVLPHDEKYRILKEVPKLQRADFKDNIGIEYEGYNYPGYYRFGKSEAPFFGKIEWNSNNCYIVAIDGQHRLTALKEIKNDINNTIKEWKIPAVILIVRKREDIDTPDLIEVVRSVFVDINDKAEKLSKARKILLNDTLPVDVLCQEIIEYSHSEINKDSLPLNFFDWRGDSDRNEYEKPGTSLVNVIELNSWLSNYFEFSTEESKNFKLPDWLISIGIPKGPLDYNSCSRLRARYKEDFVPAFHLFFNQLKYLRKYFDMLLIEFQGGDGAYFRDREKYGMPQGGVYEQVKDKNYDEFKNKIRSSGGLRESIIPKWLGMDIGMRAIIYCYSQKNLFKEIFNIKNPIVTIEYTWLEHSRFISSLIDQAISHGWFDKDKTKEQDKLLLNLIYSNNDAVINYRYDDVEKGFGALLCLICIKIAGIDSSKAPISERVSALLESLHDTYKKDIRKEVKANVRATQSGTQSELDDLIKKETDNKVKKKIKILTDYLNNYKSPAIEIKKKGKK